jgi:hypothetical protein
MATVLRDGHSPFAMKLQLSHNLLHFHNCGFLRNHIMGLTAPPRSTSEISIAEKDGVGP